MRRRVATAGLLLLLALHAGARSPGEASPLQHSVEQLRHAIGLWNVKTEYLNPDGSVARTVTGTYEFSWVVPDRVVTGRSDVPELKQASAILFYVNVAKNRIEMVSVGEDGDLWVMTGPLGGEVRTTRAFPAAQGGSGALRFTRSNITPDAFESRMEYTTDGGQSWKPGNRQSFRRVSPGGK